MIIVLIIILVIVSMVYGFSTSHFLHFGFDIINPHYPYFHLGLTFEGFHVTDDKGDIYRKDILKIGFVVMYIWIAFYTKIGHTDQSTNELKKEDDITTEPLPTSVLN